MTKQAHPLHSQHKIFVANWKMYKSFNECLTWCKKHQKDLEQLARQCHLVVCPEFTVLWHIKELFKDSDLHLGAQDCAAQEKGPYTGEVSAQSLSDIDCSHCIIGHSERRFFDSLTTIAEKITLLLSHDIVPILCMGETEDERENKQTIDVLAKHLDILDKALSLSEPSTIPIYIAYEPLWAIGADRTPSTEELNQVYTFLAHYKDNIASRWQIKLLYGGSVTEKSIIKLKANPLIEGYLIGSGSLDVQELKKVVSLG